MLEIRGNCGSRGYVVSEGRIHSSDIGSLCRHQGQFTVLQSLRFAEQGESKPAGLKASHSPTLNNKIAKLPRHFHAKRYCLSWPSACYLDGHARIASAA